MIRLDTHVVAWLFAGELERLSKHALAAVENEDLGISPIVELELTFLHEIGRLTVGGTHIINDLRERIGLTSSDRTMSSVVAAAADLGWTRDPFDRLIVGDALAAGSELVTKDGTIRRHVGLARW